MSFEALPPLSENEIQSFFSKAKNSERKRYPKILHNQGDYHNKVINFVLGDSYMQPHMHPSHEKIEKMFLMEGSFALIFFEENGSVSEKIILQKGKRDIIEVPAYTWHTYVMLSEQTVIYEIMDGVYDPLTWKKMASWAPLENSPDASNYLSFLKNHV